MKGWQFWLLQSSTGIEPVLLHYHTSIMLWIPVRWIRRIFGKLSNFWRNWEIQLYSCCVVLMMIKCFNLYYTHYRLNFRKCYKLQHNDRNQCRKNRHQDETVPRGNLAIVPGTCGVTCPVASSWTGRGRGRRLSRRCNSARSKTGRDLRCFRLHISQQN